MKKIDPTCLTDDQRQVTCLAINRKGSGGHPVAEVHNLAYFDTEYAIKCLEKSRVFFNVAGLQVAEAAIMHLREGKCTG
jgi:hypothetical protein